MNAMRWLYRLKSLWAALLALCIGGLIMLLTGANPMVAYGALLQGALFDYWGFAATLNKVCPLLLASLAVAIPFRAGLFNLGAEGQIYMGALAATAAALYLPELPGGLGIILCTFAAALGGGLWGLIPGWLKAVRDTNEIIASLLMNYLAINLVSYLVAGPMGAPNAPYPYSAKIPDSYQLPTLLPRTDAHLGVLIALAFTLIVIATLRQTAFGFVLRVIGHSPDVGRYAGMPVSQSLIWAFTIGGALAGIAGAYEVLGTKYRLFHLFSAGYGFDGLVVAFLASGQIAGLIPASAFLAVLQAGARTMQTSAGVESTIVLVIQGLVVMFVAASVALRWANRRWATPLKPSPILTPEEETS